MQIQLFIPIIIDEIRFNPDDIIDIDEDVANDLILYKAAQNIEKGILSIEEIRSKKPNYIELQSIFKLPGDIDISPLTEFIKDKGSYGKS